MIETSGSEPWFRLRFQQNLIGGWIDHQVTFHLQETVGSPEELPEALKMRVFCHLLLSCIPDRGLPETCELLAKAFEFYAAPSPPTLVAPKEERRIRAKARKASERPSFQLAED